VAVDLSVGVPAVEVLEERTHADIHGAKVPRHGQRAKPRRGHRGLEDVCPKLV
jgi:hypothetical protein